MSGVKLGLCCNRPDGLLLGPAQSSLDNAVHFFHVAEADSPLIRPAHLTLAQLDASAADLERSLEEAVRNDVTHVLFLSSRTLLPFYSIQRLISAGVPAVTGVSWTWMVGLPGEVPEIFPRLGYFDPEGRPYPYFGWSAPSIFEVDWCGLDCLLLSREALEEIAEPLRLIQGKEPALRVSHCLRSGGVPIIVDTMVQCPRLVAPWDGPFERRRLVPAPRTWRQFSRDCAERNVPRGRVHDPSYRGRAWYRQWVSELQEL